MVLNPIVYKTYLNTVLLIILTFIYFLYILTNLNEKLLLYVVQYVRRRDTVVIV